jgi:hypothetical protein
VVTTRKAGEAEVRVAFAEILNDVPDVISVMVVPSGIPNPVIVWPTNKPVVVVVLTTLVPATIPGLVLAAPEMVTELWAPFNMIVFPFVKRMPARFKADGEVIVPRVTVKLEVD